MLVRLARVRKRERLERCYSSPGAQPLQRGLFPPTSAANQAFSHINISARGRLTVQRRRTLFSGCLRRHLRRGGTESARITARDWEFLSGTVRRTGAIFPSSQPHGGERRRRRAAIAPPSASPPRPGATRPLRTGVRFHPRERPGLRGKAAAADTAPVRCYLSDRKCYNAGGGVKKSRYEANRTRSGFGERRAKKPLVLRLLKRVLSFAWKRSEE